MVWLSEVDDARPLVIALGGEAGIELLDLRHRELVSVERIDAETAFFGLGFGSLGLKIRVNLFLFFKRGSHSKIWLVFLLF